ncbi:MAG TPA: hypothetical protein VFV66_37635 [Nonomuraea sp.]|nr:hypothetical protein [Nonomuraea sp.]
MRTCIAMFALVSGLLAVGPAAHASEPCPKADPIVVKGPFEPPEQGCPIHQGGNGD